MDIVIKKTMESIHNLFGSSKVLKDQQMSLNQCEGANDPLRLHHRVDRMAMED